MKRLSLFVAMFVLILPHTALSNTVTTPGITKGINNISPQSSLNTIFSNNTSGFSDPYGLGDAKINCHTWTIKSDKSTADVSWTIVLQGSLDDTDYETLDSFTIVDDFWKRDIVNRGANWIRSSVIRNYTGTRPTITIKQQSGCN